MTLQELLRDLAIALGDYPDVGGPFSFRRWSLGFLQGRVHEARCVIATVYRRKEHTKVLDIRVPAGGVHDLSAHGHSVLRILGVVDPSGAVVQKVNVTANSKRDWGATWPQETPPEPAWAPGTFTVTKVPDTDAIVLVDPPIPTACEYRLRVLMRGVPPTPWQLTDDIDACQWFGAIRSYVMSEALASQVESPGALALSSDHMKRFLGQVGAARVADVEATREAA